MNGKPNRYVKTLATRVTKEVWDAVQKRVDWKQKKFSKYAEADVVRKALVMYLKTKNLLDKDKDYL